jgi:capsular exopolysaccharide synthesis family protein
MNQLLIERPDLPLERRMAEALISFSAPTSIEAEQYRTLRHSIERLRREAGVKVIGITSAGAGDGKTLTTLNLAGALAQAEDARILVVSADLRGETLPEYLGLDGTRSPGLAGTIVNDKCSLAKAVVRIDALNVSVLPAGSGQARPYELLASPRLKTVIDEARTAYDYVLVDTPPVLPVADCRLLAAVVDGFLVVVAAHRTPKKLLADALKMLEPAPVFGIVFNGDDQPLSAYYHYYASAYRRRSPAGGPRPDAYTR